MIGLTFRNIHSSTFKIGAKSIDRSLIPSLRQNEFTIPGRHGTVDFGSNKYDKRPIKVDIGLIKNASFEELRKNARNIAYWLSGKGLLIFDDEPDKAYYASVYSYVGIDQIELKPVGTISVTFECQPFAESLDYLQVNKAVTTNPDNIPLTINGTADTGCIITIKNTGTTNISNISITRKAVIE